MNCPYCKCTSIIKITDSRHRYDKNDIRRRRECVKCNKRFTTIELIIEDSKSGKQIPVTETIRRINTDKIKNLLNQIREEIGD